ncbi:MAG: glycosyltransferase [Phycisphaera sp.]|nr:glycosyltransferase [Phycisphaera sp.]
MPEHEPLAHPAFTLSIVAPALNEEDNVAPLVEQVRRGVIDAGVTTELIVVDDGSNDATWPRLMELHAKYPWLLPLHRDRPRGQSSAMFAGIAAARGELVATLDADLQNDPADLVKMIHLLREQGADLVQGDRSRNRRDTFMRKVSSVIGRTARKMLLGDTVRDTGCSARVMRAVYAKRLPLQFKGMHRFVPFCTRMMGGKVIEMPVHHRPREAGQTKYGVGVLTRGLAGLFDCFAVRWMAKRWRDTSVSPRTDHADPSA